MADNALTAPYALRVGQRLRLPSETGALVASAGSNRTIEEQAREFTLDIDDIVTGGAPAAVARPVTAARMPGPSVSASSGSAPSASAPVVAPLSVTRFAWPLNGRLLRRYGPAADGRVNEGITIAAATGTPVTASADGTVAYAGSDISVFGGLILIDHPGGWVSAYGHLDRVAVSVGDRVRAGSVIATSGDSGQAQQPQLYFQLRQNRRPVDPLLQLPPR